MNPLFFTATLVSAIVAIILYKWLSIFFNKKGRATTYVELLARIKDILNPPIDVHILLQERALSNQRLVRALQISNTFVSEDVGIHRVFVGQARGLLNAAKQNGWAHFQRLAIEAVRWELAHDRKGPPFPRPFDSFIQNVTLVVILTGLLQVGRSAESMSHQDVTVVAKNITTLWASSKRQDPIPPHFLVDLTKHLRRLIPDEEHFPDPSNFVVPTWETLWRVVATTVAHSSNDDEISDVFKTFNESPSDASFRGRGMSTTLDAKSVVTEAMRLHPPSKRIGRSRKKRWCPSFFYRCVGITSTHTEYANVEELLRCDIWGLDANEFKPQRHRQQSLLPEQEDAMKFVFGHGPLQCIASSWAPMAAAVISGVVLEELDAEGYRLEAGPTIGGRDGWAGWLIKKKDA